MEVTRIGQFIFIKDEKGEIMAKIIFTTDIDGRKIMLVKHPAELRILVDGVTNTYFQTSCQEFLTKYSTAP